MRSLRLVVVGGDQNSQGLLATLQFAGHGVRWASDAGSAIGMVAELPPDALILSDCDVLDIDNPLRVQWQAIVSGTRVVSLDALRRDARSVGGDVGDRLDVLLSSEPFLRCLDKALVRIANRASLSLIGSDPSIERLADGLRVRGLSIHATRSTAEANAVLQSRWTHRVLAVVGDNRAPGGAMAALDAQLVARGLHYPMVWLDDTGCGLTSATERERVLRVSRFAPWLVLLQAVEHAETWFERGAGANGAAPVDSVRT